MQTTTPGELNASGDFIQSLHFSAAKASNPNPTPALGGDVLEAFYVSLRGAEGTLRNWKSLTQAAKIEFIATIPKPDVNDKTKSPEELKEADTFFRLTMLGIIYREYGRPGGDDLVAKAAFDNLRVGKQR